MGILQWKRLLFSELKMEYAGGAGCKQTTIANAEENADICCQRWYEETEKNEMTTEELETDRMILRTLSTLDADQAFKNWTSDEDVTKYVGWSIHKSKSETFNWLKNEESNIFSDVNYTWGFVLKSTGELIGSGGIKFVSSVDMYEVGYNIMKAYWGNGLTTEALRKILEFSRDTLGIHTVLGRHAVENIGSEKVLKKLGFKFTKFGKYKADDRKKNFTTKEYILEQ